MRCVVMSVMLFFFFRQRTEYELRISAWSSDVCSSDLNTVPPLGKRRKQLIERPGDFLPGQRLSRVALRQPELGEFYELPLGVGEIGRASCRERVCQYV